MFNYVIYSFTYVYRRPSGPSRAVCYADQQPLCPTRSNNSIRIGGTGTKTHQHLHQRPFLLLPAASAAPPLTDTGNHVQEVVQALVHRRGDDLHLGEGVGHRVDAQLCHQQRDQDDLILLHLVILHSHQPHKCTYAHAQISFWVLSELCSRKRAHSNDHFRLI